MASWVARHAERTPTRIAFAHAGVARAYAALDRRVRELAHGLGTVGVRHGDRVALLLVNGLPILELMIACTQLGAIGVPLNFRLSAAELAFMRCV